MYTKFSPIILLALLSQPTLAQQFEPASLPLGDTGGISVLPTVSLDYQYNDNIYKTNVDEKSASILSLKPSFLLGYQDSTAEYGALYSGDYATYSSGSEDNYNDHSLNFFANKELNSKNKFDASIGLNLKHENRGSGLTERNPAAIDSPLKYQDRFVNIYYQYGSTDSIAKIAGGVYYNQKDYTNFNALTQFRDYSSLKYLTEFDLMVGNATYLSFDLSTNRIGYDQNDPTSASRDNTDNRFLVGLEWESFTQTQGRIKFGIQNKNFDDEARSDFHGSTVDVAVTWRPVEYSSVDFSVLKASKEPQAGGDFINETAFAVNWKHEWNSKLNTQVRMIHSDEDFSGITREDKTKTLSLSSEYRFVRWLKAEASYRFIDTSSTDDDITFDNNVFMLTVTAGL